MATLLADYSETVIAEVCGPAGICTKVEWMPSIATLKTALDVAAEKEFLDRVSNKNIQNQIAARYSPLPDPEEQARIEARFHLLQESQKSGKPYDWELDRKLKTKELLPEDYYKSNYKPSTPEQIRIAKDLAANEKLIREGKPKKASYTGPIENVKPGDILSWERIDEYRKFMAKEHDMPKAKLWGVDEHYQDSGARPFYKAEPSPDDKNPFL